MRVITKMMKGTCVYWPLASTESGGVDYDDYGQPLHAAPIELACRWEDRNEEFIDPKGTARTSRALVYVESDVTPGGMLYNGTLDELPSGYLTPRDIDGAWEILRFDKLPTFKYTAYLRTAYL